MRLNRHGFTLVELALVAVIVALLAALLFPTLASARRSTRMAICTSNLRQLGLAYAAYVEDYGSYPDPLRLIRTIEDRRILRCPQDDGSVEAASSYTFRSVLPPDFRPYWLRAELDPNTVLVICNHHMERKWTIDGERRTLSPPRYPFKLVLRSNGAVERIDVARVRELLVPGDRPRYVRIYPGEPGYDRAMR